AAADALVQAGLLDDADALLKGELTRSHSPYYFMVDLAEVAKKRGDKTAALDWYARSYAAAQGPATRVQWGARYVNARIELAPQDVAGLERMGKKLAQWSRDPEQRGALARIRTQMDGVCAKLPANDPARLQCSRALS